jgi:hypothetical protein
MVARIKNQRSNYHIHYKKEIELFVEPSDISTIQDMVTEAITSMTDETDS